MTLVDVLPNVLPKPSLSAFLPDAVLFGQTIGKTTKKALDDSVETTFPPLVLSTTEYTYDNVRQDKVPVSDEPELPPLQFV